MKKITTKNETNQNAVVDPSPKMDSSKKHSYTQGLGNIVEED